MVKFDPNLQRMCKGLLHLRMLKGILEKSWLDCLCSSNKQITLFERAIARFFQSQTKSVKKAPWGTPRFSISFGSYL